jgi:hypothetical protein
MYQVIHGKSPSKMGGISKATNPRQINKSNQACGVKMNENMIVQTEPAPEIGNFSSFWAGLLGLFASLPQNKHLFPRHKSLTTSSRVPAPCVNRRRIVMAGASAAGRYRRRYFCWSVR